MRFGSSPEAIEDQIKQWLSQGFSADELKHAANLPGPAHQAPGSMLSNDTSTIINNNDIQPGKTSADHLLKLARNTRVLDRDRQRVILLRQFGVKAFWLSP